MVGWPRGEAQDCKSCYTGSNPVPTSIIKPASKTKTRRDQEHLVSELEKSERPWGRYEVLQETTTQKVKCIWVKPGSRLSYQRHKFRAEHWTLTQGSGEVTIEGKTSPIKAGDSVEFPAGTLHRISNTGTEEIIFIEVQTGTYFGEDDIERIEDDFGRAGS